MNQSKRWPFRPTWGRFIVSLTLLPLAANLLLPGSALGQTRSIRPVAPGGTTLHEGVVISPQHGVAYLMRRGGIDAVDLASGAVRWRSDKAAKPLVIVGDRLIAQAGRGGNALDLVDLDARNGAARNSVRIPLPDGVTATLLDTAAGSFRVRAEPAGSDLVVRWEATGVGVAAQGYMPAVTEGQAPSVDAQGSGVVAGEAVLDLASSSLAVKAQPEIRRAQSASLARASLEELSAPAVKAEGRQLLSADGRHVLVTERIEAADHPLQRHRWTLYERDSGARLGSVPALVSATPFLVIGNTLYHPAPAHAVRQNGKFVEQPGVLRAVNLKTGAEMWKASVLETAFRGPFPP